MILVMDWLFLFWVCSLFFPLMWRHAASRNHYKIFPYVGLSEKTKWFLWQKNKINIYPILTSPTVTGPSHSKDFWLPKAIPYHTTMKAQPSITIVHKAHVGYKTQYGSIFFCFFFFLFLLFLSFSSSFFVFESVLFCAILLLINKKILIKTIPLLRISMRENREKSWWNSRVINENKVKRFWKFSLHKINWNSRVFNIIKSIFSIIWKVYNAIPEKSKWKPNKRRKKNKLEKRLLLTVKYITISIRFVVIGVTIFNVGLNGVVDWFFHFDGFEERNKDDVDWNGDECRLNPNHNLHTMLK